MNDGTNVNKQGGEQVSTFNSTQKDVDQIAGLLSVEVKSLPVVAGTEATITLVIRNPFADQVVIDTIETPSAAPLLPRSRRGAVQDTANSPWCKWSSSRSRL